MNKIRIAGMVEESITDGPGIRFAVFTQGCPHRCAGCHNPHTWDVNGGYDIFIEDLIHKIKGNPLVKGVTISGGEPLIQADELIPFLDSLKKSGYHICLYTGFLIEEVLEDDIMAKALGYVDVLIDGKFVKEKRNLNLKFKGSENQRIINVPDTLEYGKIIILQDKNWN